MKYEVLQLESDAFDSLEQLGTKEKYWFVKNDDKYLFKIGRENTGENWVEVVIAELCKCINLPHAEYQLAKWDSKQGVITKSFVQPGMRLVHGNELLVKVFQNFETELEYPGNKRFKVREHKLKLVMTLISLLHIEVPLGYEAEDAIVSTPIDVFVGYLLLDCWISNQDRHHENWGVISSENKIFLAPTYDHASGLGCRESEARMKEKLESTDDRRNVVGFVQRAKTPFYDSTEQLSTLEACHLAYKQRPAACTYWIEKIASIEDDVLESIFDRIPQNYITEVGTNFALKILEVNKNRLLTLIERGMQ